MRDKNVIKANRKGELTMVYSKSGAVVKQCKRCGEIMEIENFFEACARKYCKACAAASKREQVAGYMKEIRRRQREQRELEHEQNSLLKDENALLREQLRALQSRIDMLDALRRKELRNEHF